MRLLYKRCALAFFVCYVLVFPGSTVTVVLGRVPPWGLWFGSALLIVQGLTLLCWLAGQRGLWGLLAAFAIAGVGFGVEYVGVTTGFPFGQYVYTDMLQPKVFGMVPLAICCAWIMAAVASYEVARHLTPRGWGTNGQVLATASLVLLLDLQIETVASHVNQYWIWQVAGFYYDVPLSNFVAWWLTGLVMAGMLALLDRHSVAERRAQPGTWFSISAALVYQHIPLLIYLLSVLMFTAINIAYGYTLPGIVGALTLTAAGWLIARQFIGGAAHVQRSRISG